MDDYKTRRADDALDRHTTQSDGRVRLRSARGADLPAIERLLDSCGLPLEGVADGLEHFFVCQDADGTPLGAVGLELYAGVALLRSTVVAEAARNQGIAAALVARAVEQAAEQDCREIYLLTLDAEGYFQRFGFAAVDRTAAPATIRGSREFASLCPDSAVLMRKVLID